MPNGSTSVCVCYIVCLRISLKKVRKQTTKFNNLNSRINYFRFAIPAEALRGFEALLLLACIRKEVAPILETAMRHSGHFNFGFSLRSMEYWASGADCGLLGITVFEIASGSRLACADLVAPTIMHVKRITLLRIPLENSCHHAPHKGSSELSDPESLCAVWDPFCVTFDTWELC